MTPFHWRQNDAFGGNGQKVAVEKNTDGVSKIIVDESGGRQNDAKQKGRVAEKRPASSRDGTSLVIAQEQGVGKETVKRAEALILVVLKMSTSNQGVFQSNLQRNMA